MKVLVISENVQLLERIDNFIGIKTNGIELLTIHSNLLNATQKIADEMPDVVITDIKAGNNLDFELAERFNGQYVNMSFMLIVNDSTNDLLLKAIRSGFSEVIQLPITEETFTEALTRHSAKLSVKAITTSKVISVISCKGGGGATFIATNLAYVLGAAFNKKVLLIDINQYFGDASMYVTDQKPNMTLSDLCNQMSRLDYAFLESSVLTITNNFKLLAAAESPASAADILPEHLETIIGLAKRHYDYILLDAGKQIDALTVKGLDLSDMVLPVMQLVLPYVRAAKNLANIFISLGYANNKIQFIVNRHDNHSKLKISDLSHLAMINKSVTIPNEYLTVTDSVNQGVSIYKVSKNNPVSKALISLAESITNIKLNQKSLLAKLFGDN